jgi:hypothetical protein
MDQDEEEINDNQAASSDPYDEGKNKSFETRNTTKSKNAAGPPDIATNGKQPYDGDDPGLHGKQVDE